MRHNYMIMSDFTIYIKLPAYEREWCISHFGNPARFPAQSNINSVIRHYLKERPADIVPIVQQDDELAICIPASQAKPPSKFNYVTIPGKKGIAEAINDLFSKHIWEDLMNEAVRDQPMTYLLEDWMTTNGISYDHFQNLKQKFYRIMDSYRKCGVNVSRGYKHESLSKNV